MYMTEDDKVLDELSRLADARQLILNVASKRVHALKLELDLELELVPYAITGAKLNTALEIEESAQKEYTLALRDHGCQRRLMFAKRTQEEKEKKEIQKKEKSRSRGSKIDRSS